MTTLIVTLVALFLVVGFRFAMKILRYSAPLLVSKVTKDSFLTIGDCLNAIPELLADNFRFSVARDGRIRARYLVLPDDDISFDLVTALVFDRTNQFCDCETRFGKLQAARILRLPRDVRRRLTRATNDLADPLHQDLLSTLGLSEAA